MSKKSLNAKKLKQLRRIARSALLGNDMAAEALSEDNRQTAVRRAINVAARSSSLRRALKRQQAAQNAAKAA
jgi:hypothetical protein